MALWEVVLGVLMGLAMLLSLVAFFNALYDIVVFGARTARVRFVAAGTSVILIWVWGSVVMSPVSQTIAFIVGVLTLILTLILMQGQR